MRWDDKHPWLAAGGALLGCVVFVCAARYLHPDGFMNFVDWTWAVIGFLAFLGLSLNARSDYFSSRDT